MRFDPAKLIQRCPQLRIFLSNGQLASSLFDRHIWLSLRLQPNAPELDRPALHQPRQRSTIN